MRKIHSEESGSFQTVRSGKVAWRIVLKSFDTSCIQRFGSVQGEGSSKSRRGEVNPRSSISRRIRGSRSESLGDKALEICMEQRAISCRSHEGRRDMDHWIQEGHVVKIRVFGKKSHFGGKQEW
jgi:hypothetical protein